MKILEVNTDRQLPNKIFVDESTNKAKQVTDKAKGLPFFELSSANQPIFSNDGYYDFQTANTILYNKKTVIDFTKPFTYETLFYMPTFSGTKGLFSMIDNTNFYEYLELNVQSFASDFSFNVGAKANNALLISTDSGGYGEYDSLNHLMLIFASNKLCFIINGVVRGLIAIDFTGRSLEFDHYPTCFGNQYVRSNFGAIHKLYYARAYNHPLIDIDNMAIANGDVLFDPSTRTAFNYYHRHKDDEYIKAYISSKYLKNAIIDNSNKIESLYSSVNVVDDETSGAFRTFAYEGVQAKQPTLTNQGLLFDKGNSQECLLKKSGVNYFARISELNNWYISLWFKPNSTDVNQFFLYFNVGPGRYMKLLYNWTGGQGGGRIAFADNSGTNIEALGIYPVGDFVHVAFERDEVNQRHNYFINGYYVGFTAFPNLTYSDRLLNLRLGSQGGSLFTSCYIDDVLPIINRPTPLINVTGYSVGDKVFEPPKRGGFEDYILQYPIGGGQAIPIEL